MMGKSTKIEWCDSSLNLMMGCDGCELWNPKADVKHCYAGTLTELYGGGKGWPIRFDKPALFPERLKQALAWPDLTGTDRPDKPQLNGYPRTTFLDDMGDTFTESLPVDWLAPHVPAMADSPHIWQFLTKRPRRMYKFFSELGYVPGNFWLMTSVTNQATASRIPELLRLKEVNPDVILGLSCEPMLGPLDLSRWLECPVCVGSGESFEPDPFNSDSFEVMPCSACGSSGYSSSIRWVIVGGESGSNARPMHPEWVRSLRDQCTASGVAFFLKQWGEWIPRTEISQLKDGQWGVSEEWLPVIKGKEWGCLDIHGEYSGETTTWNGRENSAGDNYEVTIHKVGKKSAGRTWNEFPTIQPAQLTQMRF